MGGWHHRLNGHKFEQALGVGEGQGSLVCCSPWDCKAWDTTEQLNNNDFIFMFHMCISDFHFLPDCFGVDSLLQYSYIL